MEVDTTPHNVVAFPALKEAGERRKATPLPITTEKVENECQCYAFTIVEASRMLVCKACGRVTDPFDYIWERAVKDEQYEFQARLLWEEAQETRKQLEVLRRQEQNVKARIKRGEVKMAAFTPDELIFFQGMIGKYGLAAPGGRDALFKKIGDEIKRVKGES